MKVFVLFTGEWEQRTIHSVHSSRADAIRVDSIVRKIPTDWKYGTDYEADIEEHELDASMCSVCGYEEHWHITHPETWKHEFVQPTSCVDGGTNGQTTS